MGLPVPEDTRERGMAHGAPKQTMTGSEGVFRDGQVGVRAKKTSRLTSGVKHGRRECANGHRDRYTVDDPRAGT